LADDNSLQAMTMVLGELFFNFRMMEDDNAQMEKRIDQLMSLLNDEQRAELLRMEGGNA
jgi:hypothetical protein